MSINIFDKKNILLFEPENGVEMIYYILDNINHYNNFTTKEARRDGLTAINKLFELDLIEIFHWGEYESELENKELSIFQKMMYLQELWFVGADFGDFAGMPMFKFKDWYINKLKEFGLEEYNDWTKFVNEKIGNLENWILENKPKNDKKDE